MTDLTSCRLCGSRDRRPLPDPHASQSVLSDGRICPRPLGKAVCAECGTVSYTTPQSAAEIRALYDSDYDLGAAPGTADLHRNAAYADYIATFLDDGQPRHVLEVGCGSGQTLASLATRFPANSFDGIEAAPQLAARRYDNLRISQAFVEELKPPATPHDLVYSINVIEHAADPAAFLAAVAGQLAPGGTCIIICPASHPANLELLFRDHVTTLTSKGIAAIATAAGFTVARAMPALPQFAGFQAAILILAETPAAARASTAIQPPPDHSADSAKGADAADYLAAWQGLDEKLLERVQERPVVRLFGAGEMAALLRCYTPRLWDRVEALVVDDMTGARNLGRPLMTLSKLNAADDAATIVATHPRAQRKVAKRLADKGLFPVRFDDVIVC